MEIGPESHEMVEHAAHNAHHHAEGGEHGGDPMVIQCAIMAAVLAVLAAIVALGAGHAEADAILKQTKASDQWAYYQAKSVKGHMYEMSAEIVTAMATAEGKQDEESVKAALEKFEKAGKKYDSDKDEIQKEAQDLEKESAEELKKHVNLALGVSCFQVGIVLVSVAMLVKKQALIFGAGAAGVLGLVFAALGFVH